MESQKIFEIVHLIRTYDRGRCFHEDHICNGKEYSVGRDIKFKMPLFPFSFSYANCPYIFSSFSPSIYLFPLHPSCSPLFSQFPLIHTLPQHTLLFTSVLMILPLPPKYGGHWHTHTFVHSVSGQEYLLIV